jgi:hypothetical protein
MAARPYQQMGAHPASNALGSTPQEGLCCNRRLLLNSMLGSAEFYSVAKCAECAPLPVLSDCSGRANAAGHSATARTMLRSCLGDDRSVRYMAEMAAAQGGCSLWFCALGLAIIQESGHPPLAAARGDTSKLPWLLSCIRPHLTPFQYSSACSQGGHAAGFLARTGSMLGSSLSLYKINQ